MTASNWEAGGVVVVCPSGLCQIKKGAASASAPIVIIYIPIDYIYQLYYMLAFALWLRLFVCPGEQLRPSGVRLLLRLDCCFEGCVYEAVHG